MIFSFSKYLLVILYLILSLKSESLIIERSKKTLKNEFDIYGRLSKDVSEKLRQTSPVSDTKTSLLFDEHDEDVNENTRLLQKQ
jgi:hypothetical protein